jgi:hypothetical protein
MIGKPLYFDPDIFCSTVEMLIKSDEVERAFSMLRHMAPAYYRDNPTKRMIEIRESLHKAMFTPNDYAHADGEGADVDVEALAQIFPPRAQLLAARVKALNDEGKRPNLMEIAPGTFWLPYALKARALDFTYEYQSLRPRDLPFTKPGPTDLGPNIFVAFEIIEHLHNEAEIYQAYLKFKKRADFIYLSTPLYTYGGGLPEWRENALGHLRTYTPQELGKFAMDMFSGYKWSAHLSETITLEGISD